jgi:hypothetical protein
MIVSDRRWNWVRFVVAVSVLFSQSFVCQKSRDLAGSLQKPSLREKQGLVMRLLSSRVAQRLDAKVPNGKVHCLRDGQSVRTKFYPHQYVVFSWYQMNYLSITNLFHLEIFEGLYIRQTGHISGLTSGFLYWGLHLFVVRVTAPPVIRGLSQNLPEWTAERYKKS